MTFMRGAALAACMAALVGCGGAGSFKGEVDSKTLAVQDSVFFLTHDDDGSLVGMRLLVADVPNLCETLQKGRFPKNTTYFMADLYRRNSDGTFLSPDATNYNVVTELAPSGSFGFVGFYNEDANCTNTISDDRMYGKSGMVSVTDFKAEKGGYMNGTFDVTFGTQNDTATGSFSADYCDLSNVSNISCE